MSDMLKTIVSKSDRLNADDLIGGLTPTITITRTSVSDGDLSVKLHYEGENGKPFVPGLSMRRVLVLLWGNDSKNYVGRSMTLYRDPKVKYGGQEVGGIRISHMSHIDQPQTVVLTESKTSRKPFTVRPLNIGPTLDEVLQEIASAKTQDELKNIFAKASKAFSRPESRSEITAAKDKRKAELTESKNPMENVK